jgi:pyruvate,water dikinase
MNWILTAKDDAGVAQLGAKAAALQALHDLDISIPDWFVVSPRAFSDSLPFAARSILTGASSGAAVARIVENIEPSRKVMHEVLSAYGRLTNGGAKVAVRSSAIDEDGNQFSFAGQLQSFLYVTRDDLANRIAMVWRSAFAAQVLEYRQRHGLALVPGAPAVLIQCMVDATVAGVAFSADPVTGRAAVSVINAVCGTAEGLVGGLVDADSYRVDNKQQVIEIRHSRHGPRLGGQPILEIQRLAQVCADRFERPQDIEWAMDDRGIHLLQSRAITTLGDIADPDGRIRLWDNSNIVESYGGITSPLTYSFARGAYEAVYREFARLLGMPNDAIQQQQQLYANMLGYIQGRVYYNLLNWYRALAMLPGFSFNREFMEQMMGVKEGLPAEIVEQLEQAGAGARIKDGWLLLRALVGLLSSYLSLPRRTRQFYERLDSSLGDPGQLPGMRLDQLAEHYRDLERCLLYHWDAPLINDLFAMIFHGLLRRLSLRWCREPLHNDLLCDQGGLVSAEPAHRIRKMATLAAADRQLVTLLRQTAGAAVKTRSTDCFTPWNEFKVELDDYLQRFGDRCLEELKLESDTTGDDPRLLLATLSSLAEHIASGATAVSPEGFHPGQRAQATMKRVLRGHPLRRFIFTRVLGAARRLVRERENLRFERTRVFGRVRRIVLEMGKRLVAANRIDQPRDVFYLEINELLGTIEGTTTTTRLADLIALRKRNERDYREAVVPAERFQTCGAVHVGNQFTGIGSAAIEVAGDSLQGLGACPGVVEGIARCIEHPAEARIAPGEILVAARTDPGWVMLFASAAGVLVERGSLLSHSAIVTRELGIPSVVSLPGLTSWLRDGDRIRFDGATGLVQRISCAADCNQQDFGRERSIA